MSEYSERWKQRSRDHDVIHTQYQRSNRRENTNQDPSCGICNNDFPEGGRQKFNMFWEWYRKITDEFSETENEKEGLGAHSYSDITRRAFNYLLSLGDGGIVAYGLKEDGRSLDENEAIFRIMESVRYRGKLILSGMEIRRKIVEIFVYSEQFTIPIEKAEHYIDKIDKGNLSGYTTQESSEEENNWDGVIEISEEEARGRFFRFWIWYKEIYGDVVQHGGEISIGHFKIVISLKEEVLKGKRGKEYLKKLIYSFTYRTDEGVKVLNK